MGVHTCSLKWYRTDVLFNIYLWHRYSVFLPYQGYQGGKLLKRHNKIHQKANFKNRTSMQIFFLKKENSKLKHDG